MFGDLKYPDEHNYNPKYHVPLEGGDQNENMKFVVENIFKKAQNEKDYCNFYGSICEKIMRLELNLRRVELKKVNLRKSEFRKALLEQCENSFQRFFDKDAKNFKDEDDAILYKHSLMSNIKFVGELNRRALLSESILVSIFDLLLSVENKDQLQFVNDDTVEGATILICKIGPMIDDKIKNSKKEEEKLNKKKGLIIEKYQMIFERFE